MQPQVHQTTDNPGVPWAMLSTFRLKQELTLAVLAVPGGGSAPVRRLGAASASGARWSCRGLEPDRGGAAPPGAARVLVPAWLRLGFGCDCSTAPSRPSGLGCEQCHIRCLPSSRFELAVVSPGLEHLLINPLTFLDVLHIAPAKTDVHLNLSLCSRNWAWLILV